MQCQRVALINFFIVVYQVSLNATGSAYSNSALLLLYYEYLCYPWDYSCQKKNQLIW